MVGERPDVGALRLRRAHRRPNDPERGQTTRESGREPDESSKSGCSTDTAIAAIGSKSRILNSLLEALQNAQVELRVTLSYFIEPNPSARGSISKFYYPSHRLRFDVQRPLDGSTDEFVARINAAAHREDDGDPVNPKDPNWYLGELKRHRGSLHQDVWTGTAAELASRGFVAVYPSAGWWRTRPALERYDLPARYSLIVSIRTQQTELDLYTAISQKISVDHSIVVDR